MKHERAKNVSHWSVDIDKEHGTWLECQMV